MLHTLPLFLIWVMQHPSCTKGVGKGVHSSTPLQVLPKTICFAWGNLLINPLVRASGLHISRWRYSKQKYTVSCMKRDRHVRADPNVPRLLLVRRSLLLRRSRTQPHNICRTFGHRAVRWYKTPRARAGLMVLSLHRNGENSRGRE